MRHKILLITLFFVFLGNATAQRQIHYAEAITVARNMLNYLDYDNNSISDIAEVRVFVFQETDTKIDTLLYEIELVNGAEILLSGNRVCKPVLVHGHTVSILGDYDELPCGVQFFLDSYIEQVKYAFTYTDTLYYNAEWDDLKTFDELQIGVRGAEVIAPLLTTKWGQRKNNCDDESEAYNHFVTQTNDGQKCSAGCVAVAMGQIMNYWKYPVWTSTLDRQFDWCNMVDSLCMSNNTNYSEQRDAVSWLLYKCGTSVNMTYCSGGPDGLSSSSYMSNARNALVSDFTYGNNAMLRSIWVINIGNWFSLLRLNLDNKLPVMYSGQNSSGDGGHAFVCDGYNNDGTFHFNLGWRGLYDGNYSIFALNPDSTHNYSALGDQQAIFNLYPSANQDYCNYSRPLESCYYDFFSTNSSTSLKPHEITPKTFSTLISCPETSDTAWRFIPDTANAEYVAHDEIVLQSGFKVKRGAEFTARIAPCSNCDNQQMPEFRSNPIIDTAIDIQKMAADKRNLAENKLTLCPNPATQVLTINGIDELADMHIYDNRGSEIRCWKFVGYSDSELKISVVQLPVGTYIIRASQRNGKMLVGKFVKQ
ncbi:MAG: C10 family peptidase [Bacteroidales bacterium]|nr:C10 family peptidase [Bacteroidales bacterium]